MTTYYAAEEGDWSSTDRQDRGLLERIRNRYDYMVRAWKEIRDEAEKDQKALSTAGPWKDEERDDRDKNGRPCVHLDQLNQYVSALVNQVRSEPIAVKVNPASEGANEDTAELRAKRIRAIEYESNATQAYETAFECAASMGFGAFGVTLDYKSWDSNQLAIKVRRLANPWSVIWDPDCKEADSSDMRDCFVLSKELKSDFERNHPDASITSFGEQETRLAGAWFDDDSIQVAEYWYVEKKKRRIFFVQTPQGTQRYFDTDLEGYKVKQGKLVLKDGTELQLLDDRTSEQPIVRMVLTNGIEILDETDWPGKEIPIVPVVGRERFIRVGNKIKRVLESYIRMARDGQMLFDYYKSNEAESIGMTPKTPWIGYKGQFQEEYWDTIHKVPRGYAEVETMMNETGAVLPLPTRMVYEPPVQALEIGAESARRAIQAAVASYGYTRLDDTNVKSGVALRQLDQQRDLGSYHLVDNYKIAIRRAGRIINDLLDNVETDPMQVSLRNFDDEQQIVAINGPEQPRYRLTDEGQHEVTISEGPSYQTQREESALFTDSFLSNMQYYQLDPQQTHQILAQVVKLRRLGPVGDNLIKILTGQVNGQAIPAEVQQQMGIMQQQMQALNAYAQQKEAEIADLKQKAEGKVLDNVTRKEIAQMQDETKRQIAVLQAEVEKFKVRADMAKTHEELTSQENQKTQEMGMEAHKMRLEEDKMAHDSEMKTMAEDNKREIAKSKPQTKKD